MKGTLHILTALLPDVVQVVLEHIFRYFLVDVFLVHRFDHFSAIGDLLELAFILKVAK